MIICCSGCHSRYDVTGRPPGTRARCRCGNVVCIPNPSHEAAMLVCPACGASVSPDHVVCSYCRTALAVVACPTCFGRVFVGSKHCAHCGAEILVPAAGTDVGSQRRCPRCAGRPNLFARTITATLLDECHECGGVWLDALAFDRLIQNRDDQTTLLTAPRPCSTLEGFAEHGIVEPTRYLPCADCGQLMNRKNFAGTSGVIVDICKPHGLWFDKDELGRIVQFVAGGGLDRARRTELERVERLLREKRAALSGLGYSGADAVDVYPQSDWVLLALRGLRGLIE